MKKNLTKKIIIALILGILLGLSLNIFLTINNLTIPDEINISFLEKPFTSLSLSIYFILELIGDFFINILKFLVFPLVFFSISTSIANSKDLTSVGKIGIKTIIFYISTTVIAIIFSLIFSNIILNIINNFNSYFGISPDIVTGPAVEQSSSSSTKSIGIIDIIFIALFLGYAVAKLGDKVQLVKKLLNELYQIVLKLLSILMIIAPIAIFSLIFTSFLNLGLSGITNLFGYVFASLFAMFLHVLITYSLIIFIFTRLSPVTFIKNILPAITFALSTTSSSATLPITEQCVENNCGVSKDVSSFVLPIGSTINMDGTAIMQGTAVVFIASVSGFDLTISSYISVIVTTTLLSIGTGGVPGSGTIMLTAIIDDLGLPVSSVSTLMGVDRIIDMGRTTVNIIGDALCSIVVANSENKIDKKVFYAKNKETVYE